MSDTELDLDLVIDKRGDTPKGRNKLEESKQYDENYFIKNKEILKELSANESMLKKDPEKFANDDTLFLYRLPISDKLRKKIYVDIMKEYNKK